MLRWIAAFVLSGLAGLMGVLGVLLPTHRYDWADEQELRNLPDPDAVLTVLVLCVLGILAASASIAFLSHLERSRMLRWLLLGVTALALMSGGSSASH